MGVALELRGKAAWIVLDEPERRNALSESLLDGLVAALAEAEASDARAIVLTGRGSAFCAGADLSQPASPLGLAGFLRALLASPKPVVAAVNGAAFGGGVGIVAAADVAIASDAAVLSFSEVRLGVTPAIISVVCVPKLGEHQARRLFLDAARLSAEEAREVGLLHRVVPAEALAAAVDEEVEQLALGAPGALAAAKALVGRVAAPGRDDALWEWAAAESARLFATDDAAEGRAAFRERRPPSWASREEQAGG